MRQYLDAVREVLETGTRKENRTGVDSLSTFGITMKFDLRNGNFPLLTTKKVNWKNIVVENLWFLSGQPGIGLLQKHKCKFWDAWADKDGLVPSTYGNFWRRFPVHDAEEGSHTEFHPDQEPRDGIPMGWNDQIAWVVAELKRNPMSRRLVVSAWAPGNAQTSKLPPCHIVMVFNVQNLPPTCSEETCGGSSETETCVECGGPYKYEWCGTEKCKEKAEPHLCLHLTQRSCDIALGVPYNIAGYAFLLELVSRFTGIKPGIFAHTLIDAHAYTSKPDGSMAEYDHVPGLREQLERSPRPLPRLSISPEIRELSDIDRLLEMDTTQVMEHFTLEGYFPHDPIGFKVAV